MGSVLAKLMGQAVGLSGKKKRQGEELDRNGQLVRIWLVKQRVKIAFPLQIEFDDVFEGDLAPIFDQIGLPDLPRTTQNEWLAVGPEPPFG